VQGFHGAPPACRAGRRKAPNRWTSPRRAKPQRCGASLSSLHPALWGVAPGGSRVPRGGRARRWEGGAVTLAFVDVIIEVRVTILHAQGHLRPAPAIDRNLHPAGTAARSICPCLPWEGPGGTSTETVDHTEGVRDRGTGAVSAVSPPATVPPFFEFSGADAWTCSGSVLGCALSSHPAPSATVPPRLAAASQDLLGRLAARDTTCGRTSLASTGWESSRAKSGTSASGPAFRTACSSASASSRALSRASGRTESIRDTCSLSSAQQRTLTFRCPRAHPSCCRGMPRSY
jgi:hypothetical protein